MREFHRTLIVSMVLSGLSYMFDDHCPKFITTLSNPNSYTYLIMIKYVLGNCFIYIPLPKLEDLSTIIFSLPDSLGDSEFS